MNNTATFDFVGDRAIRRNNTYRFTFRFQQSNGLAVDLSGATAIAGFKKSLVSATATNLIVSVLEPPTGGSISLVIPASATAALPTGKYVWDLLITLSNGDKWRAVEGEFHVVGGVS